MEKIDILRFACSAIDDGEFLIEYTGRGENISPEFKIDNLAENAKTILITLEDLSHPIKDFTHWVIWNIPAEPAIPSGIPAGKVIASLNGACQGVAYGNHRYAGPKPPKGKTHDYRFTVYVLDDAIDVLPSSRKKKVLAAAQGHILQQGSVVGSFE